MEPQVVVGDKAAAAAHFIHLPEAAGDQGYPGANAITVGLLARKLDQEPIFPFPEILQQAGPVIHVIDDDLQAAVVVHVSYGRSPGAPPGTDPRACVGGYIQKFSVAEIPVQQALLPDRENDKEAIVAIGIFVTLLSVIVRVLVGICDWGEGRDIVGLS